MDKLVGLLGVAVFLGLAYLMSNNRRAINWRLTVTGIGIQLIFAFCILHLPFVRDMFDAVGQSIQGLLDCAKDGLAFVLGDELARSKFVFAFVISASIIFVGGLTGIAFHLGVLQVVVRGLAWAMKRSMGISGAEALSTGAEIFLGQVESQLLIRNYIKKLSNSELMSIMAAAMATISGSALVAYIGLGINPTWLLMASFMTAPSALVVAKMMYPETDAEAITRETELSDERTAVNWIEAGAEGAWQGLKVAANVMAQLIFFIGVVALTNYALGGLFVRPGLLPYVGGAAVLLFALWYARRKQLLGRVPALVHVAPSTVWPALALSGVALVVTLGMFGVTFKIQDVFGVLFTPVAFLTGIPWDEAVRVGPLLGTKTVLNEFIAYMDLAKMSTGEGALSVRTQMITTIALCGFANLGSIGINIGGLSRMAPERQSDIAKVGIRALVAATLASWLTAALAGLLM
jgi:concentrative nucleoside transporter, CNT family